MSDSDSDERKVDQLARDLDKKVHIATQGKAPVKPATKPAKPATKPAKPATKPAKPATKPALPATYIRHATDSANLPLRVRLSADTRRMTVIGGVDAGTQFKRMPNTNAYSPLVNNTNAIEDRWAVPAGGTVAVNYVQNTQLPLVQAELAHVVAWQYHLNPASTDADLQAVHDGYHSPLPQFQLMMQTIKDHRGVHAGNLDVLARAIQGGVSRGLPGGDDPVYAYRLLHPKDDVTLGLHAVDPSFVDQHRTLVNTMNVGHYFGFPGSPFIFMYQNPLRTHVNLMLHADLVGHDDLIFAAHPPPQYRRTRLARIDLRKVVGFVAKLSQPTAGVTEASFMRPDVPRPGAPPHFGVNPATWNSAMAGGMVVLRGFIPPEAIEVIINGPQPPADHAAVNLRDYIPATMPHIDELIRMARLRGAPSAAMLSGREVGYFDEDMSAACLAEYATLPGLAVVGAAGPPAPVPAAAVLAQIGEGGGEAEAARKT